MKNLIKIREVWKQIYLNRFGDKELPTTNNTKKGKKILNWKKLYSKQIKFVKLLKEDSKEITITILGKERVGETLKIKILIFCKKKKTKRKNDDFKQYQVPSCFL